MVRIKNFARLPIVHCAENRCKHEIYKLPQCFICRIFIKLAKSGKTPSSNCPYYDHTQDIKNFRKKPKKLKRRAV